MFAIQEAEQDRAWLELEDRMTAQQGEINAAMAAHVAMIAEHLEAGYWTRHDGVVSPSAFLTWKLADPARGHPGAHHRRGLKGAAADT